MTTFERKLTTALVLLAYFSSTGQLKPHPTQFLTRASHQVAAFVTHTTDSAATLIASGTPILSGCDKASKLLEKFGIGTLSFSDHQ